MAVTEITSSRIAAAAGNVPGIRLRRGGPARGWRHWLPFYVMLAPGLLFFIIWHYVPIWQVQMAFQTVRIIPPPVCHGGIVASTDARPHRTPMPVGPYSLCALNA